MAPSAFEKDKRKGICNRKLEWIPAFAGMTQCEDDNQAKSLLVSLYEWEAGLKPAATQKQLLSLCKPLLFKKSVLISYLVSTL
jgi:hypothetical protein